MSDEEVCGGIQRGRRPSADKDVWVVAVLDIETSSSQNINTGIENAGIHRA